MKEGILVIGWRIRNILNYDFDCDSTDTVYLTECEKCSKQYVGSTITSFRKRFNNYKSSLVRYGKVRGEYRETICMSIFFLKGNKGLDHVMVKTDVFDTSF